MATRNREDVLLALVRGRDAGLVFRREIRALLDTWWAWEETMPEAAATAQRDSGQDGAAGDGQEIRAEVEERLGERDLREGLYELDCPNEVAARFADDVTTCTTNWPPSSPTLTGSPLARTNSTRAAICSTK